MLLRHGVNVALGVVDEFAARNTRFDAAWVSKLPTRSLVFDLTDPNNAICLFNQAALESRGQIDRRTALALVTTNLEKALGVSARSRGREGTADDIVVYKGGGMFDLESKVVGVISAGRGVVDLF